MGICRQTERHLRQTIRPAVSVPVSGPVTRLTAGRHERLRPPPGEGIRPRRHQPHRRPPTALRRNRPLRCRLNHHLQRPHRRPSPRRLPPKTLNFAPPKDSTVTSRQGRSRGGLPPHRPGVSRFIPAKNLCYTVTLNPVTPAKSPARALSAPVTRPPNQDQPCHSCV